jgi:Uma2 family endonuclease
MTGPSPPTGPTLARHRLSVDDCRRMQELGILKKEHRVELIDGVIMDLEPITSEHAALVLTLAEQLAHAVGASAIVRTGLPLHLDRYNEPSPDIMVLRLPRDGGQPEVAVPRDVLLVVEVADRTGAYALQIKVPLYARHGIPEAWLFDLQADRLLLQSRPRTDGYAQKHDVGARDALSPEALPELMLAAEALLY